MDKADVGARRCRCGFTMHISGFIRKEGWEYDVYVCGNPMCRMTDPVQVRRLE